RDGSTRAGNVNSLEARIEFDYIGTARHRQEGDGRVSVEIEDGHQVVAFAREEGAMMFRVKRHTVIPFAASYRVTPYHFIRRRIDHRENILVLQVYVHFLRDGVVLWHSGFTVEAE